VAGLNALFEALLLGKKSGNGGNVVYGQLEQVSNFFDRLEELQKHNSEEVYKKLVKILETFFNVDSSAI
jgi:hypothetical protein